MIIKHNSPVFVYLVSGWCLAGVWLVSIWGRCPGALSVCAGLAYHEAMSFDWIFSSKLPII